MDSIVETPAQQAGRLRKIKGRLASMLTSVQGRAATIGTVLTAGAVTATAQTGPPELTAFDPPVDFASIGTQVGTLIGQALLVIIPVVVGVALVFMVVRKLKKPGG